MKNAEPFEVIIGLEVELYLAPVATEFAPVNETPSAPWVQVGKGGHLNYTKGGLSVTSEQGLTTFTPLGCTMPTKVWRATEGTKFGVEVADLSIEEYAKALNDATVNTTPASPGVAGTKDFDLYRGTVVANYALMLRFPSAEMEDGAAQFQVPRVYQSGNPSPVFKDDAPAALQLEFSVLYDRTEGQTHPCGQLVEQTDEAES